MLDVLAATKAADPNIIVPAIIAAIPVTITAVGGFLLVLVRMRKTRHEQEQRDEHLRQQIETNHGLRPGEYLELIGPIALWASTHTQDDNELRQALGLRSGDGPRLDPALIERMRRGRR